MRRALVLGGSGHVGARVVELLAARDVDVTFTYHRGAERAAELAARLGARVHATRIDLADPAAVRALCADGADILLHCAVSGAARALAEVDDALWADAHAVNVRAPFLAAQTLVPHMTRAGRGDIVFAAGLDASHPLPAPVHYAATQGALTGMTRALAKELGPAGIRVNLALFGLLDGGIARDLATRHVGDFKKYSAMQRAGSAQEAARALCWLALDNTYMTGAVLPITGGL